MDRQQEFVLRTLEERDIRFVRLWFTDVLGTLKSVAVRPGRARGRLRRGHRLRRLAPSRASPGSTRPTCWPSPTRRRSRCCPGAASNPGTARMFCDILLPDGSPVLRRPAPRPASAPWPRPPTSASPSTPTPRSSSSSSSRARRRAQPPEPVDQAGYFDHVPHGTAHDFRRAGHHHARVDGHLGGVQPPRGRARARTRSTCATPTR